MQTERGLQERIQRPRHSLPGSAIISPPTFNSHPAVPPEFQPPGLLFQGSGVTWLVGPEALICTLSLERCKAGPFSPLGPQLKDHHPFRSPRLSSPCQVPLNPHALQYNSQ